MVDETIIFDHHNILQKHIHIHIIWPEFISDCPPSVRMAVTQHEAAARPAGVVQFTADVQGMSIDDIMYYRWSIREFNYPLYTFSVRIRICLIHSYKWQPVSHAKYFINSLLYYIFCYSGITIMVTINESNQNTFMRTMNIKENSLVF